MALPRMLTARAAAWKALNQCNIFKHDTAEVLSRLLKRTDRPAQATDIVFGIIRNRGTIDHILKKCSALDSARVKPSQWNLLRIGVYELIYAPKTADYAILNEAVELARQACQVCLDRRVFNLRSLIFLAGFQLDGTGGHAGQR